MSATHVPEQLQKAYDIGDDAHAFVVACLKASLRPWIDLHNRVVTRTKLERLPIVDTDPNRVGDQHGWLPLRASYSDDAGVVAAKIAGLAVTAGHEGEYLDEFRRSVFGLPIYNGHNLDGSTVVTISDEAWARQLPAIRARKPQHLAVIDDVLFALAIAVLIALVKICLPMIIEWGKKAFQVPPGMNTGANSAAVVATSSNPLGLTDQELLIAGAAIVLVILAV
ncbi:MAG: hypothetical protein WCO19_01910 [Candidatus Saccharibacteria bacterium]